MALSNNPMFSPENLLMLSGNILAAPNFGAGLGTGLQQLGANVSAQQKEQAERMRQMQEQRQAGNYLRQQNPGVDLSNYTPGMINAAASSTLEKQLAPPSKPKFQVLPDGSYGWVDEGKQTFTKLGTAAKNDLPADVQEYEYNVKTQGFKGSYQDWQKHKAGLDDGKTSDRFKTEIDTMKTYRSEKPVENYQITRAAYEKMRNASQLASGQGDIAIIYSYMKMLDPTSVVREGEYATAEQTSGLPEGLVARYNKLVDGERLTPEMRKKFIEAGAIQYNDAAGALKETNTRYQGLADQYDVPTDRFMENPKVYDENPPGVVDYREFFK